MARSTCTDMGFGQSWTMNTIQVSAYQRRARNACPDPEITLWVVDGFGGLVSREPYRSPVDMRE
jgi:hypothetical protein